MINLKSLSFNFGTNKILDNLSFSVNAGEIIGIVGPNGAGKSTLLNLIAGLLPISSGNILIDDKSINELSKEDIGKKIAVVHQSFNPTFSYTVEEVVSMGRYVYSKGFGFNRDNSYVQKAIEDVDIISLKKREINTLSGGELQLTFLARALAQNTPIILLDEATSSLDITHTVRFLKTIRERVNKSGITVLAVIHDLNLALNFADRLLMLNRESVIGPDSPKEILSEKNIEKFFKIEKNEFLIDEDKKWISLNL